MLRDNHHFSKDIGIFVSAPQALGFVTPRLTSHAESLTTDYTEVANFVKLLLPKGEIDFVTSPNLTYNSYIEEELLGRTVKVETSAGSTSNSKRLPFLITTRVTNMRWIC